MIAITPAVAWCCRRLLTACWMICRTAARHHGGEVRHQRLGRGSAEQPEQGHQDQQRGEDRLDAVVGQRRRPVLQHVVLELAQRPLASGQPERRHRRSGPGGVPGRSSRAGPAGRRYVPVRRVGPVMIRPLSLLRALSSSPGQVPVSERVPTCRGERSTSGPDHGEDRALQCGGGEHLRPAPVGVGRLRHLVLTGRELPYLLEDRAGQHAAQHAGQQAHGFVQQLDRHSGATTRIRSLLSASALPTTLTAIPNAGASPGLANVRSGPMPSTDRTGPARAGDRQPGPAGPAPPADPGLARPHLPALAGGHPRGRAAAAARHPARSVRRRQLRRADRVPDGPGRLVRPAPGCPTWGRSRRPTSGCTRWDPTAGGGWCSARWTRPGCCRC